MSYMDYVIRIRKKYLRTFLKFYFNVRCTNNMCGAQTICVVQLATTPIAYTVCWAKSLWVHSSTRN